jgi:hypothetical protein
MLYQARPRQKRACERRGRETGDESSERNLRWVRRRDGERHSGHQGGTSLRGAVQERWPRSVRASHHGSPPVGTPRRRQRVSSGSPRRGTIVSTREKCVRTRVWSALTKPVTRSAKASGTRPSLGPEAPAHVRRLERGATSATVSTSGKPAHAGGTESGTEEKTDERARLTRRKRV